MCRNQIASVRELLKRLRAERGAIRLDTAGSLLGDRFHIVRGHSK